jgi:hypothetical protein
MLIRFLFRTHHSSRPNPQSGHTAVGELEIDPNEPTYCYCSQVSFGDMIACDGENVKNWKTSHELNWTLTVFFLV